MSMKEVLSMIKAQNETLSQESDLDNDLRIKHLHMSPDSVSHLIKEFWISLSVDEILSFQVHNTDCRMFPGGEKYAHFIVNANCGVIFTKATEATDAIHIEDMDAIHVVDGSKQDDLLISILKFDANHISQLKHPRYTNGISNKLYMEGIFTIPHGRGANYYPIDEEFNKKLKTNLHESINSSDRSYLQLFKHYNEYTLTLYLSFPL